MSRQDPESHGHRPYYGTTQAETQAQPDQPAAQLRDLGYSRPGHVSLERFLEAMDYGRDGEPGGPLPELYGMKGWNPWVAARKVSMAAWLMTDAPKEVREYIKACMTWDRTVPSSLWRPPWFDRMRAVIIEMREKRQRQ